MQQEPIDYSRKWYVLFAVSLALSLETLDTGIVNLALPTLGRTFGSDFAAVQWVVLAFVLTQTTLMLIMGRLGDMFGKKPIFVAGFVVTGVGATLCALAPGIGWLIAFRVVQAAGVAMALALSLGIVAEAFPPTERGMALGLVSSIVAVGNILGPLLGGLILGLFSWRWVFLVTTPLCIVGLPIALRFLPHVRPPRDKPPRFDYLGAGAFLVLLLCFLLATTYGRSLGYGNPRILLLFGGSLLFLLLFLAIERRAAQPVIDLRLFRNRVFSVNLSLRLLSFIVYAGVTFLLPFYNENVLGLTPRLSGLLLTVPSLAFGIIGVAAGIFSDRFGSRPVMVGGIGLLLIGALTLSRLPPTVTFFGYILALLPLGAGLGIFQSPNNSVIFTEAPRERIGMVSSLTSVIRTLARSASIALIGSLWASRVLIYNGDPSLTSATRATPMAQLRGLHDAFLLTAGLALFMLGCSLWEWQQARRAKDKRREAA